MRFKRKKSNFAELAMQYNFINYMSVNYKLSASAYIAPECEACEALTSMVICQSGSIEDWVEDENGF